MTIINPDPSLHLADRYAATIGFFDGVHRGHQYLLQRLKREAAQRRLPSMVITFAQHPLQVLHPEKCPPLLTTMAEKQQLLAAMGIDALVLLPFDAAMARLSVHDFMQRVLHNQLGVALLLMGYDNHFGHRTPASGPKDSRRATMHDEYVTEGRRLGIEVIGGEPLTVGESYASSSRIRQLLQTGRVAEAAQCLGRAYALAGTVVHGEQQGRRMGFPTANLQPGDAAKLLPQNGAYAVMAELPQAGQTVPAMTNIGLRPTFDGTRLTVETHLFGHDADLYGQPLVLHFVDRLRPEQVFPTAQALALQLQRDATAAQQILSKI